MTAEYKTAHVYGRVLETISEDQAGLKKELTKALGLIDESVSSLRKLFIEVLEHADEDQKKKLQKCIGYLQFDDIVQQLLRKTIERTDSLSGILGEIVDTCADSEQIDSDMFTQLMVHLDSHSGRFGEDQSIQQESMEAGSTELF